MYSYKFVSHTMRNVVDDATRFALILIDHKQVFSSMDWNLTVLFEIQFFCSGIVKAAKCTQMYQIQFASLSLPECFLHTFGVLLFPQESKEMFLTNFWWVWVRLFLFWWLFFFVTILLLSPTIELSFYYTLVFTVTGFSISV